MEHETLDTQYAAYEYVINNSIEYRTPHYYHDGNYSVSLYQI